MVIIVLICALSAFASFKITTEFIHICRTEKVGVERWIRYSEKGIYNKYLNILIGTTVISDIASSKYLTKNFMG